MTEECSCGGEMSRGRPTRTGTGLPIRFSPTDDTDLVGAPPVDLAGWTCEDCGRVRLRIDTLSDPPTDDSTGSGECPLCSGPTVVGQLGGSGFNLRLVDRDSDLPGTDRYDLFGHACADCGAVALYATDVHEGAAGGSNCPSCEGSLRRTAVSTGAGSLRIVGDKRGDGALAPRRRVDPVAWTCEDCGLALLYDRTGG